MTLRDLKVFEIAACDNGGFLIRHAFFDKGDQRVIAAFTSASDLLAFLMAALVGDATAKRETIAAEPLSRPDILKALAAQRRQAERKRLHLLTVEELKAQFVAGAGEPS